MSKSAVLVTTQNSKREIESRDVTFNNTTHAQSGKEWQYRRIDVPFENDKGVEYKFDQNNANDVQLIAKKPTNIIC